MGRVIKLPQLKVDLLLFTRVEILGDWVRRDYVRLSGRRQIQISIEDFCVPSEIARYF